VFEFQKVKKKIPENFDEPDNIQNLSVNSSYQEGEKESFYL